MATQRHHHYGSHAILACLALVLIVRPMAFLGAWGTAALSTLATVQIVAVVAALRHARGPLCEPCIAAMPLNPQARVDRLRPLLKLVHAVADASRLVSLTVFLGAYVAILLLVATLDSSHVATLTLQEMLTLMMLVLSLGCHLHSPLRPWCPYCDRGGRGKPVAVPDPVEPTLA